MKVAIVVGGRFLGFDIARELQRRGALAGIVSQYARAPRAGIQPALLRWNPWLEAWARAERRVPGISLSEAAFRADRRFGRWAAARLPEADVVQAWTGYALESLREARRQGMLAVALRGSAHIMTQVELVEEEFARFGLRTCVASPRMVQRECEEYAEAHCIQVISTFALRTFLARGVPRERLLLTTPAVDVSEVRAPRRERRPGEPLRVLFLGTVCLRKGVQYLLPAVRALGPDAVRLTLAGGITGDGRIVMARFATGDERLTKVPRGGLAALLAEHDVLVLPSVEDGFGAVILEAMAAGLAVVASTHTGGPDVIMPDVSGMLVEPRSVEQLIGALEPLARDPERCRAMGLAGADSAARARSWPRFVDDMLPQYEGARENVGRRAAACV